MRDEQELGSVVSEISEEIRRASWGLSDWQDVCRSFTRLFPGSYCAMLNQNLARPDFGFQVSDGLDERHFNDFLTHYGFVNPWQNFWRNAPSGGIIVAERDEPISLYQDGEFYNDWMRRVGDYDAAVGMKVGVYRDELIYLPIHYSTRLADPYDRELEYVMTGIRPVLFEAVRLKQQLRDIGERHNALAALVDRNDSIAFVIDETLRLREANPAAILEFKLGSTVHCINERIRFCNPSFNDRLQSACAALFAHGQQSRRQLLLRLVDRIALISVSRLPDVIAGGLLSVRPQFLVQITDPHRTDSRPDKEVLSELYDLTPREAEFCCSLATGLTLQQACIANRISYETGRQRLKTIFEKTGRHSQAQLRLLLSRL